MELYHSHPFSAVSRCAKAFTSYLNHLHFALVLTLPPQPSLIPSSLVNEFLYLNVQAPIPSTQWHIEVSIWFSTCLAKLQPYMVEWATAPTNVPLASQNLFAVHTPTNPIEKAMCQNQLVRDKGLHQSFSILGMALILGLGGILVLLGMGD